MKQKLVIIASVIMLALSATPKVSAQWVQTNAPTGQLSYAFTEMGTNLFTLTQEFSEDGTGVLLSTDSGEDWAFGTFPNTSFVTITAVGSNLFGSSHGVYLSTNSGSTWSRRAGIGLGTKAGGIICSFLESKGKLFAASWSGVIFSTDSGTSWTESNAGLTDTLVGDLVLDGTNLFAGTNDSGIFLSTDNGISWSPVNNGLTGYGNGIYPLCVMGTNLFAGASGEGIFRSTNNGSTWMPAGLKNTNVSQFAVSGTNLFAGTEDYVTGTNSGVFLSTDSGASWTTVNTGLTDTSIQALAVCGTNLVVGTSSMGIWQRPLSQMLSSSSVTTNPSTQSGFTAFPNPLTQSTTINFISPESGAAEITIVNLLGNSVARIYSGEMNAGAHSYTWDATAMPPGTYWCEIRMNGMVNRIPLVLQR